MSGVFKVFLVRLEDYGCDCSSPDLKLLFVGFFKLEGRVETATSGRDSLADRV